MRKIIKKKNGFTLTEIILIVGIMGVAFTGVYTTYAKAQTYMNVLEEVKNIDLLREGIEVFSANESSYINLNNTILNNANATPEAMRDGTGEGISSSFGSSINVTPTSVGGIAANNAFTIGYANVPTDYCAKIVTQAAGKFQQVMINGTSVKSVYDGVYEVDVGSAVQACDNSPATGASINFVSVSAQMNSLAAATAAIMPATPSVRPVYSTPLPAEPGY